MDFTYQKQPGTNLSCHFMDQNGFQKIKKWFPIKNQPRNINFHIQKNDEKMELSEFPELKSSKGTFLNFHAFWVPRIPTKKMLADSGWIWMELG